MLYCNSLPRKPPPHFSKGGDSHENFRMDNCKNLCFTVKIIRNCNQNLTLNSLIFNQRNNPSALFTLPPFFFFNSKSAKVDMKWKKITSLKKEYFELLFILALFTLWSFMNSSPNYKALLVPNIYAQIS